MNKIFSLLTLIALLTITVACESKRQQADAERDPLQETNDSLLRVLSEKEGENGELIDMMAQLQTTMREITEAEGRVTTTMTQTEGSATQQQAENIQNDMAYIAERMAHYKALVAELQQKLRASKQSDASTRAQMEEMIAAYNKQLQEKQAEVENLRLQLEQKDIRIAELDAQNQSLTDNVNELSASAAEKDRQLGEQDAQLHQAWYVFGTKKELKEQNILKDGEALKDGAFNKNYFTQIDYRVTKNIRLYSKSATIKTSHPADSYALEADVSGQYTLRITDADKFWSLSKYLVIVVK